MSLLNKVTRFWKELFVVGAALTTLAASPAFAAEPPQKTEDTHQQSSQDTQKETTQEEIGQQGSEQQTDIIPLPKFTYLQEVSNLPGTRIGFIIPANEQYGHISKIIAKTNAKQKIQTTQSALETFIDKTILDIVQNNITQDQKKSFETEAITLENHISLFSESLKTMQQEYTQLMTDKQLQADLEVRAQKLKTSIYFDSNAYAVNIYEVIVKDDSTLSKLINQKETLIKLYEDLRYVLGHTNKLDQINYKNQIAILNGTDLNQIAAIIPEILPAIMDVQNQKESEVIGEKATPPDSSKVVKKSSIKKPSQLHNKVNALRTSQMQTPITVTIDQCALDNVLLSHSATTVQDLINISYDETHTKSKANPSAAYHAPKKGIAGEKIIKVDPANKSKYIGINLLDALIHTAGRTSSFYNLKDGLAELDQKMLQSTAVALQKDLNMRFGKHYSFAVTTKACQSTANQTGEETITVTYAPKNSAIPAGANISTIIAAIPAEQTTGQIVGQTTTVSSSTLADIVSVSTINTAEPTQEPMSNISATTEQQQFNNYDGGCIAAGNPSKNTNHKSLPFSGLGLAIALGYIALRKKGTAKQELAEKAGTALSTLETKAVKLNYAESLQAIAEQSGSEYAQRVAVLLTAKAENYDQRMFAIANYVENNNRYMTVDDLTQIQKVAVAASQSNYARKTQDITTIIGSLTTTLDQLIEQKTAQKQQDISEQSLYAQLSRGSIEKARELALQMTAEELIEQRQRISHRSTDQLTQYEQLFFEEMFYAKELETLSSKGTAHKHEEIRLAILKGNYQLALQSMLDMNVVEIKQIDRETDYASLTPEMKTKVEEAFDAAAKYARAHYGNDTVRGLEKSLYGLVSKGDWKKAQQVAERMDDQELETARITMNQMTAATAQKMTSDEYAFFEMQLYRREIAARVDANSVQKNNVNSCDLVYLQLLNGNYATATSLLSELSLKQLQETEKQFDYNSVPSAIKQSIEEVFDTATQGKVSLQLIINQNYQTKQEQEPTSPTPPVAAQIRLDEAA